LSFCFLLSPVLAQQYGYQGRRVSVALDIKGMLNIYDDEFVNHNFGSGPNILPSLELDYVINRKESFGIDIEMLRTGRKYGNFIDEAGLNNDQFLSIQGTSIGGHFRIFMLDRKGAIAPVGNYLEPFFSILMHKGSIVNGNNELRRELYPETTNLVFGVALGKQRVLFERFTVKTEIQSGINFPIVGDPPTKVSNRMLFYYLFNVNIGLGALLF